MKTSKLKHHSDSERKLRKKIAEFEKENGKIEIHDENFEADKCVECYNSCFSM